MEGSIGCLKPSRICCVRSVCSVIIEWLSVKQCCGESGMFCLNLFWMIFLKVELLKEKYYSPVGEGRVVLF